MSAVYTESHGKVFNNKTNGRKEHSLQILYFFLQNTWFPLFTSYRIKIDNNI
jgi:hypothetical protein